MAAKLKRASVSFDVDSATHEALYLGTPRVHIAVDRLTVSAWPDKRGLIYANAEGVVIRRDGTRGRVRRGVAWTTDQDWAASANHIYDAPEWVQRAITSARPALSQIWPAPVSASVVR